MLFRRRKDAVAKDEAAFLPQNLMTQIEPYGLTDAELEELRRLRDWRQKAYVDEFDPMRVTHFLRLLKAVRDLPSGDYIEMGTQHGGTAKIIWDTMPRDSSLYCCDTFTGFEKEDLDIESNIRVHGFTVDSITDFPPEGVEEFMTRDRAQDGHLHFVVGRVPESLAIFPENASFRFVHLDMDLYEPTRRALEWLWPRLVPGAVLLFHDYDAISSVRKAVDEFLNPLGVVATPLSDRFGSSVAFRSPA